MNGSLSSMISVRSLEDYQVLDPRGETLGTVQDVLLDETLGHARYFVVSLGGALSLHRPRYVVPAASVRLDTESEALVIDIAPERFADAAPFEDADGADPAAVYRI